MLIKTMLCRNWMEDYGWVEFIFLEMNLDENCYEYAKFKYTKVYESKE